MHSSDVRGAHPPLVPLVLMGLRFDGCAAVEGLVRPLSLLRVDAGGALLAGLVVVPFAAPIAALHGLPTEVVRGVGLVNLAYAAYGGRLAWGLSRGRAPSRRAVLGLIVGNAAWPCVCVAIALTYRAVMGPTGFAHVLGEGLYVGTLAALERRWLLPAARPGP
jgi:hypothetical protein